jgi:ligand-binding SRPBCC domain-containing protein
MKFKMTTLIDNHFQAVWLKFNRQLFENLKPSFLSLNVVRFDGCRQGDTFDLKIGIFGQWIEWKGKISKHAELTSECYFIDEGLVLPRPLTFWQHKHRIVKSGVDKSFVIDEVEYKTNSIFLDYFIYPGILIGFFLRKPYYRKLLGAK